MVAWEGKSSARCFNLFVLSTIILSPVLASPTISSSRKLSNKSRICQFYEGKVTEPDDYEEDGAGSGAGGKGVGKAKENSTLMICSPTSSACFAVWNRTESGEIVLLKQGCWEASPPQLDEGEVEAEGSSASNSHCPATPNCTAVDRKPSRNNHPHFCCCSQDYCNGPGNLRVIEVEASEEEEEEELFGMDSEALANEERRRILLILTIVVIMIVGIVTLVAGFVRFYFGRENRKKGGGGRFDEVGNQEEHLLEGREEGGGVQDEFDLGLDLSVVLGGVIATGQFSSIHVTNLPELVDTVMKIYPSQHKEFFQNEKDVYEKLGSGHENLLRYYGSSVSAQPLPPMYGLLLSKADGNLRDHLKSRNLSVEEMMGILVGVAKGLSYMHGRGVVHRDLTPRNILLRQDCHPVIADFGLSVLTCGPRYTFAGQEKTAEFNSITEAGTLRYMAPELLEGAVNLKDCENALKQADVYSLGLVGWEVAGGCAGVRFLEELGENGENEGVVQVLHEVPYEEEAGPDSQPTSSGNLLPLLTHLISTLRLRPSFHKWADSALTRSLKETLTECWDPEPDARLTALCVHERWVELQGLACTGDGSGIRGRILQKKTGKRLEEKVLRNEFCNWVQRNLVVERNLNFAGLESGSVGAPSIGDGGMGSYDGESTTMSGNSVRTGMTDVSHGGGSGSVTGGGVTNTAKRIEVYKNF